jgi:hypothetical protein
MSPYEYVSNWLLSISKGIYGIVGHHIVPMPNWLASSYVCYFLGIFALGIRKFSKKDIYLNKILIIALFYLLVLLFLQNYKTYLERNIYTLALQGRYIFPVLPLVYVSSSAYIGEVRNTVLKTIFILLGIVMFLLGCIPFFMYRLPVHWFSGF